MFFERVCTKSWHIAHITPILRIWRLPLVTAIGILRAINNTDGRTMKDHISGLSEDDLAVKVIKLEILLKQIRQAEKLDRAWQTSKFRKVGISLIIYVFGAIFLASIGIQKFLIPSLIPVLGYLACEYLLPFSRLYWEARSK